MWEVSGPQTPIEIFTSLDNGRQLVGIFIWYNWIGLALSSTTSAISHHIVVCYSIISVAIISGVNIFVRFGRKYFSPSTSAQFLSECSDRVTEWTFIPTWQVLKWQIDQIFSSVTSHENIFLNLIPSSEQRERATVSLSPHNFLF